MVNFELKKLQFMHPSGLGLQHPARQARSLTGPRPSQGPAGPPGGAVAACGRLAGAGGGAVMAAVEVAAPAAAGRSR